MMTTEATNSDDQAGPVDAEAPADGVDAPKADLIPRSEASAAFKERDEAKKRARDLEARLTALESGDAVKQLQETLQRLAERDDQILQLSSQLEEASGTLRAAQRKERDTAVRAAVLDHIPQEERRPVLLDWIDNRIGTMSDDGDPGELASQMVDALKKMEPAVFEAGRSRTGAPKRAGVIPTPAPTRLTQEVVNGDAVDRFRKLTGRTIKRIPIVEPPRS